MTEEYKYVPVEPTDEMRKAWNTADGNSESYFSESAYKAMLAAAPEQPSSKVIAYRVVCTKTGNPRTDWIDGALYDDEPIFPSSKYQLAYEQPSPAEPLDREAIRNEVIEAAAEAIEAEGEGWGEDSRYRPHYSDMAAIVRAMKYQPAQPSDSQAEVSDTAVCATPSSHPCENRSNHDRH